MEDNRIPTALWLDGHLRQLNGQGIAYYVTNRGAYAGGLILLKVSDMQGQCMLLVQQRDLEGELGWMHVLGKERVAESEADSYIRRAIDRDPDLWVVEIEDRHMHNPFEGKVFL